MALKLYTYPGNTNAWKALIAAEIVGVKIEVPSFQFGVTNKSPEFLAKAPLGKIPVLETPSGSIFESNAIARYVARLGDKGLFGSSLIDLAHVEQWVDFTSNEIIKNIAPIVYPRLGYGAHDQKAEDAAFENLKKPLAAFNTYLAGHTFLVGEAVTLADIVAACNLYHGITKCLTTDFMKPYPHVVRYFNTVANQPAFKKIIGEAKQAEKIIPISSTPVQPAAAAAEKPSSPKKKGKKGGEKEAAPPAPAAAPPAAAGGDEEEAAPKPKAKNPLDLLPPSKMVMDDWKRLYSNTKAKDFREVAIKGFWDMYDPEGYSLWFCNYKFNEENTVNFVTMNKVGGFLQRMDMIRKHGFAKMAILGTPPYSINGVWLFRGKEIPQIVKDECYDMDLYEWKQVDIKDKKQKDLVSDLFEEPDLIMGKPVLEVKCFK